jgi:hypothetical protein
MSPFRILVKPGKVQKAVIELERAPQIQSRYAAPGMLN